MRTMEPGKRAAMGNTCRVRFPIAVAASVFFCQSCAFSYTDADGNRHMLGLVDITVHSPAAPETFAGNVVDVAAIGLIASVTAQGGYIALGYSHEATAALRDNVLVIGDPVRPLAPLGNNLEGVQ